MKITQATLLTCNIIQISHAVADEELPGHLIRVLGGRSAAPSCSNHYGPLCSDCNTLMVQSISYNETVNFFLI